MDANQKYENSLTAVLDFKKQLLTHVAITRYL
jgi:hypothetical protein